MGAAAPAVGGQAGWGGQLAAEEGERGEASQASGLPAGQAEAAEEAAFSGMEWGAVRRGSAQAAAETETAYCWRPASPTTVLEVLRA